METLMLSVSCVMFGGTIVALAAGKAMWRKDESDSSKARAQQIQQAEMHARAACAAKEELLAALPALQKAHNDLVEALAAIARSVEALKLERAQDRLRGKM